MRHTRAFSWFPSRPFAAASIGVAFLAAGCRGGEVGCPPESDGQLCARLGKDCGAVSAADRCGEPRTVASCGECSGAGETCGGSGVENVCGDGVYRLPPDRSTVWSPGVSYGGGGIPARTTPCATLSATDFGDGSTDASAAIQAAVDGCPAGQVVQLSAGTFTVDSFVLVSKGITLRGAGPGRTTLQKTNGEDWDVWRVGSNTVWEQAPIVIVGPSRWPVTGTSVDLTADAVKGATTVEVQSAAGLSVGEVVLVDEIYDPALVVWESSDLPDGFGWFMRYQRPNHEWKEVSAISGNAVTFTTPMHMSYLVSFQAQLTPMAAGNQHVKWAGVEDMTLRGGTEGNVELVNAAYSWVKHVESTFWGGVGISLQRCFRCEIRDSYVHDGGWPNPGGGGYALSFEDGTADSLIENNISMSTVSGQQEDDPLNVGVNKVFVSRAAGAGCVIGYNYFDNGFINYNMGWQEVGLNASHMVGSHHVLMEGNWAFNADGDKTHGNQTYHTFFRNHLTGRRSIPFTSPANGGTIGDVQNPRCAGLAAGNWWMSFVGNVLGEDTPAWRSQYDTLEQSDGTSWNGAAVWRLGYDDVGWPATTDPKVLSTLIRDGNWDWLQAKQSWTSSPAPLPSSLYLAGKPAFFGTSTWPWVDPGTGAVYTLPAKARYDAGTPNDVSYGRP